MDEAVAIGATVVRAVAKALAIGATDGAQVGTVLVGAATREAQPVVARESRGTRTPIRWTGGRTLARVQNADPRGLARLGPGARHAEERPWIADQPRQPTKDVVLVVANLAAAVRNPEGHSHRASGVDVDRGFGVWTAVVADVPVRSAGRARRGRPAGRVGAAGRAADRASSRARPARSVRRSERSRDRPLTGGVQDNEQKAGDDPAAHN